MQFHVLILFGLFVKHARNSSDKIDNQTAQHSDL